jgi:endonuclease/exonuclease/phosphatase family metal-dependent hydrolase
MSKLVQLNIEGDAHIPLVKDFLREQNPDIVCLQEVYKKDMGELCDLSHSAFLLTMNRPNKLGEVHPFGVAIFSRTPFLEVKELYYAKPEGEIKIFDRTSAETIRASSQRGVLLVELENGVCVGSVHHTWTPNGLEDEFQIQDTHALVSILGNEKSHILCGDFNIPRGYNSCYDVVTASYEDCVPKTIKGSMHIPLHRVRNNTEEAKKMENYMVDYIFRTKDGPKVSNVRQYCGMSDHCALVAEVSI